LILNKLVTNQKLNYAHGRKSLLVVLFLSFSLAKRIYVPNLIKIGREMGALSWTHV